MKPRTAWIVLGGLGVLVVLYAAGLALALGLFGAAAGESAGMAGASATGTRQAGRADDSHGSATPVPALRTPSAGSVTATPRRVTATPPAPGPTPVSGVDWPKLADVGDRQPGATTPHFQVFTADPEDTLLNEAVDTWAPELEALLARTSAKLGGRSLPKTPVQLVFTNAYGARCRARGLAATGEDPPLMMIFIDEATPEVQLRAVLAHEMAHHLTLGERFVGDGILTEGIANWAADDLMLRWQGYDSWDAAVRDYLARGDYVSITEGSPLSPEPGEDCIARRDRVYNVRTSFVDWLVRRIGLDTVLAMPYVEVELPRAAATPKPTGEATAGPDGDAADADSDEPEILRVPDYEAATGLDLAALERLWLAEVEASAEPGRAREDRRGIR